MENIRRPQHEVEAQQEQALDNILRTAHETLDIGNQSKLNLQRQGETINKIDGNLDKVERNLKKSEYIVKGMTSTFGFIKSLFKSTKKFEIKEEPEKPVKEEQKWEDVSTGNMVKLQDTIPDPQSLPNQSRVDSQLDQLISCVKQLKSVNEDIGETLNRQNA